MNSSKNCYVTNEGPMKNSTPPNFLVNHSETITQFLCRPETGDRSCSVGMSSAPQAIVLVCLTVWLMFYQPFRSLTPPSWHVAKLTLPLYSGLPLVIPEFVITTQLNRTLRVTDSQGDWIRFSKSQYWTCVWCGYSWN